MSVIKMSCEFKICYVLKVKMRNKIFEWKKGEIWIQIWEMWNTLAPCHIPSQGPAWAGRSHYCKPLHIPGKPTLLALPVGVRQACLSHHQIVIQIFTYLIMRGANHSNIFVNSSDHISWYKQACKPRSYPSLKLGPTDRGTVWVSHRG